jgi:hypothetical protein
MSTATKLNATRKKRRVTAQKKAKTQLNGFSKHAADQEDELDQALINARRNETAESMESVFGRLGL